MLPLTERGKLLRWNVANRNGLAARKCLAIATCKAIALSYLFDRYRLARLLFDPRMDVVRREMMSDFMMLALPSVLTLKLASFINLR